MDNRTKNIIQSVSSLKRSPKNVAELKEAVESHARKRCNTMMSDKVKNWLKDNYGTTANGINTLALKDMGEL